MVTLDGILANHIKTKIEQDNLVSRLPSLCDEKLINEIREIGSNMALDVAAEMQGTNPFDLSRQITVDQENDSLSSSVDAIQYAKARHDKTISICDRITSREVAMIVVEHLRSKYGEPQ